MLRTRVSFGFVLWIIVGVIVAANRGRLTGIDTLGEIITAILSILLWPLLLLGISVTV